MHSAERERVVQAYNARNSSKAAPICAGCLAILVLIVVLGAPPGAAEQPQTTSPRVIAAAASDKGIVSAPYRQQTFEARRVAFAERRHLRHPTL
jgi:hypothetical protein